MDALTDASLVVIKDKDRSLRDDFSNHYVKTNMGWIWKICMNSLAGKFVFSLS